MRAFRVSVLVAVLTLALAGGALAGTMTFMASDDATIFSESGDVANAQGEFLFVGQNNQGNNRRALVRFDVSALPEGATVTVVTLQMEMTQSNGGEIAVAVFPVEADWSEGSASGMGNGGGQGSPAQNGDVTWTRREWPGVSWAAPGGDFSSTPSAQTDVDGPAIYTWSSPAMVTDVRAWRGDAALNRGWILIGGESAQQTAKRFASGENANSELVPRLIVEYDDTPVERTTLGGLKREFHP